MPTRPLPLPVAPALFVLKEYCVRNIGITANENPRKPSYSENTDESLDECRQVCTTVDKL